MICKLRLKCQFKKQTLDPLPVLDGTFLDIDCFVLVRMENSVLGNALEGVPEESEEEEEQQPKNSNIENADNLDGQYKSYKIQGMSCVMDIVFYMYFFSSLGMWL